MNSPKTSTLRKLFESRVTQENLDNNEIAKLVVLQSETAQPTVKQTYTNAFPVFAACLCLLAIIGFVSLGNKTDYIDAIADEVVYNHLKLKPLEVETSALSETRGYFSKLDFVLSDSSQFPSNQSLLGGRYCSIGSHTAAQLRFGGLNGELSTVYQVNFDSEKHADIPNINAGGSPLEIFHSGLKVVLWVENGLLMVKVSEL